MAIPTLTPAASASAIALPETGSLVNAAVSTNYPYGMYVAGDLSDTNFVTGATEQVNYTFRKLGGDVLDIELTEKNIFAAYEEAVLEYSYIVNVHQAKNILHSALGTTTGTFDHDGERTDPNSDADVQLKYPKFRFGYARRNMEHAIQETGLGGTMTIYTASFEPTVGKQDYDLQKIVQKSTTTVTDGVDALTGTFNPDNHRLIIRKVFYKSAHAMWRFYGYYGGMNSVGNMSTYGMYADDSTFEVIPAWQNKLQAMVYEDAIYTRNSHYSYEIKNNKLRLYPPPHNWGTVPKMHFEFHIEDPDNMFEDQEDRKSGVDGVNNMNTLPMSNIAYKSINSIGKQWIRRFALSLTKEVLGQVRSKFGNIPIPNNTVQLNGASLITESKAEQTKLREELQKVLDEMTYEKMTETQTKITQQVNDMIKVYPYFIYQG
tara:strand:+ start:365 stop:1660 length:1296 start_codon:yes stop_codon:yes gene_type:complete